jgi:hypothetical protein
VTKKTTISGMTGMVLEEVQNLKYLWAGKQELDSFQEQGFFTVPQCTHHLMPR